MKTHLILDRHRRHLTQRTHRPPDRCWTPRIEKLQHYKTLNRFTQVPCPEKNSASCELSREERLDWQKKFRLIHGAVMEASSTSLRSEKPPGSSLVDPSPSPKWSLSRSKAEGAPRQRRTRVGCIARTMAESFVCFNVFWSWVWLDLHGMLVFGSGGVFVWWSPRVTSF